MLLANDYDGLLVVAVDQVTGGAHVLDVCVALTERQDEDVEGEGEEDTGTRARPRRRRGGRARRVLRGRTRNVGPLEGTFDHGEEGYGLWLDPAVQDNPIYAEHWAGHRPIEVTIEEDQIVIRRTGDED